MRKPVSAATGKPVSGNGPLLGNYLSADKAADIRADGLRILTPERVAARLDTAREHSHITAAEHAELNNHHFAQPFTKPMFFGTLQTTAVDGRSGRIYVAQTSSVGVCANVPQSRTGERALLARRPDCGTERKRLSPNARYTA